MTAHAKRATAIELSGSKNTRRKIIYGKIEEFYKVEIEVCA